MSFADFTVMTHLRYCGGVAQGSAHSQHAESKQNMKKKEKEKPHTLANYKRNAPRHAPSS